MTATAHATGSWAAAHRTALLVLFLAAAVVAAATVLTVRLVSSAVPVPAPSISQIHQSPAGNGTCQLTRPGRPC